MEDAQKYRRGGTFKSYRPESEVKTFDDSGINELISDRPK